MEVLALILYGLANIISLVSWVWLIILASKEGASWVIAMILCTLPAAIALVAKDFDKAKIPFGLMCLSIVLSIPFYLGVGGGGGDFSRPSEVTTFKQIQDAGKNYSVRVPTSWEVYSNGAELFAGNEDRETYLNIETFPADEVAASDLDELTAELLRNLGTNAPTRDAVVGGFPAKRVEFRDPEQDGSSVCAVVDAGDTYYTVRAYGFDTFREQDRPVFDTIVASFTPAGTPPVEAGSGSGGGIDLTTPDPPSATPKPQDKPTEEELLAKVQSANGDGRLWALQQWRTYRLDRARGARARMLAAWGNEFTPDAQRMVLTSLRDLPLEAEEALECLKLEKTLPSPILEPIIKRLRQDGKADPDSFAEALGNVPETKSFLVEETLVEIGRPRAGAIERLLAGRGDSWALSPEGREMLGRVSEVGELKALATSENAELRALGCDLLGRASDGKAALAQLKSLLKDETPEVRRRSAAAMQGLGNGKAAMYLAIALVKEDDDQVKGALNTALEGLPREDTLSYLRKLYKSKKAGLRMAGVVGARAIKSPKVVPLLAEAIRDEQKKPILMAALEGLRSMTGHSDLRKQMNPAARDLESLAMTSKDKEVQRLAARVYYAITGRVAKR